MELLYLCFGLFIKTLMEDKDNNKVVEDDSLDEDIPYNYNFIDEPWNDRSQNRKIGIVLLLVAIFVATMALVIHNIVIHYRGFNSSSLSNVEIDCNLIKVDKFPYVARIHSFSSNEMICVGVVLSPNSVLANELCLKSGPIRLRLGSPTEPRCKKGFSVDAVDPILHDGSVTKTLVILTTFENMKDCAMSINIGVNIKWSNDVNIIGRPYRGEKILSFQIAKLERNNVTIPEITNNLNKDNIICVRGLAKCPVRVGDLLLQNNKIFGLASMSVRRRDQTKIACFAKLSIIRTEVKEKIEPI